MTALVTRIGEWLIPPTTNGKAAKTVRVSTDEMVAILRAQIERIDKAIAEIEQPETEHRADES